MEGSLELGCSVVPESSLIFSTAFRKAVNRSLIPQFPLSNIPGDKFVSFFGQQQMRNCKPFPKFISKCEFIN